MHCLYLAQRIPYPPNKGEKLRSFHQINFLRKQGIDITVAAPYEEDSELEYFDTLKRDYDCEFINHQLGNKLVRYVKGLVQHISLSEAHFYDPTLQQKIDEFLKDSQPDAIVCTASSMANYVFRSREIQKLANPPRVIMDFMDMDSHKWRQYAQNAGFPMRFVYKREASLVERLENRVGKDFDACFFVAEPETELFMAQIGEAQAKVLSIGNGIDPDEFHPAAETPQSDVPHVLFAGVMDYTPNVDAMLWFYTNVWPDILAKWPQATLTIAGMNPTPAIAKLNGTDNITVTGFVDDILPYFHASNIFVAPFRIARGIQNKILQAFASGLPVISTSMGAEGILCESGDNIEIGDEASAMVEAFNTLINDREHYLKVRAKALATIDKHYSWDGKLAPLYDLITAKTIE